MQFYRFIVSGKVQGVFYRKSVSQNAMKAGHRGTIKNLTDGSVEVYAELYDDELDGFLELLKQGSPTSIVADISYEIAKDIRLEYDGFVIL
ncbi:MAG: acylphosphatase [Campylobacterales bacterium]|nr:acylphosphatase [Campylobacterota bacterium]MBD3842749.1 acylphosphatase [Campylobacterales bacterium]